MTRLLLALLLLIPTLAFADEPTLVKPECVPIRWTAPTNDYPFEWYDILVESEDGTVKKVSVDGEITGLEAMVCLPNYFKVHIYTVIGRVPGGHGPTSEGVPIERQWFPDFDGDNKITILEFRAFGESYGLVACGEHKRILQREPCREEDE